MLNPTGPVNSMLARFGIAGPGWFSDPNWAKPSLLIMALWAAGDTIVIFSAAMLDVPKELYEAADLDGVNSRQRFRHVTMPFLSPVMVFAIVTGMIYTFQYFTEAFVARGSASSIQSSSELLGYPGQSLLFYSTELYQQGFVYFKTGYASAMAWILFLVIFVCTIGFLRLSRGGSTRRVTTDGRGDTSRPAPVDSTARRRARSIPHGCRGARAAHRLVAGLPAAAGRLRRDGLHDPAAGGDRRRCGPRRWHSATSVRSSTAMPFARDLWNTCCMPG